MTKTYRACLAGCGRMGATIDDEVIARNAPNLHSHLPYSHAASVVACERTEHRRTSRHEHVSLQSGRVAQGLDGPRPIQDSV